MNGKKKKVLEKSTLGFFFVQEYKSNVFFFFFFNFQFLGGPKMVLLNFFNR